MERKKGVVEICYQVVLIIYKKMHLWKIPVPGRRQGKDRSEPFISRRKSGGAHYRVLCKEVNNVPHDIFRGNSSDIVCYTWKK